MHKNSKPATKKSQSKTGKSLLASGNGYQVFLGAEESGGCPFNTLDAVFQLYRVVCEDLRDWPPSTKELAAKTLTDIARSITEGD